MKSVRTQLFLVIAGVVLAVEAVTMVAALHALKQDAIESSSSDLEVGERVFRELLETRERQLATGVRVLADDFGFKEAVSTNDRGTLESVLANHGKRINADLVAFVTRERSIAASTHRFSSGTERDQFPFTSVLEDSQPGTSAARTVLLPEGAFQLVVAPVFAPQLIGWVVVGFTIDDGLAGALKELTGLDVSFLTFGADVASTVPASTLDPARRQRLHDDFGRELPASLTAAPEVLDLEGSGDGYLSYGVDLTGDGTVAVLLQRALSDALSGYHRLLGQLSLIFAGTLALAVLIARFVAGGVTQPLDRLATAARRIADGRYDETVAVEREDELGVLAKAFNEMQDGIAQREQHILYQSRHDGLTDLPNRVALNERLAAALDRAKRHGRTGAVLLIDLRAFKAINDTFGHETGDDVLRELARRFVAQSRSSDVVARYGGNCFVVLAEDIGEGDLRALADRVALAAKEALALPHAQVRVDLTIGVSTFPADEVDAEGVRRRAEIAMYGARAQNTTLAFYRTGQDEMHLRRLEIMSELSDALDRDDLAIVYQPKLDLRTERVEEAEALVRWKHARLGVVSPGEFVPIAEQSGLMRRLTTQVLRKVAAQIREWSDRGIDIKVSANISTIDLIDVTLPERVLAIVAEYGVPVDRLQLEITESALMGDTNSARDVLDRLRAAGFRLSIDDFGTGYSSLVQLKHMPVSELKIDKSFVLDLPDNEDDEVIVRSTIELGHNLGLTVVAEGAENDRCIAFLRELGCEIAQGYGISRPLPPDDFLMWLDLRREAQLAPPTEPADELLDEPARQGGKLAMQI